MGAAEGLVDSSEVSFVDAHQLFGDNRAMPDDVEVSEPHIQSANRFRLLSLGCHSSTMVSG